MPNNAHPSGGLKTMPREALRHLVAWGRLAYRPSRQVWGTPGFSARTVQALVNRGYAYVTPLAAYPTEKARRHRP